LKNTLYWKKEQSNPLSENITNTKKKELIPVNSAVLNSIGHPTNLIPGVAGPALMMKSREL